MTDEPEIERCVCGETAREKPYTRSVKADDHTMYRVDIYWVECPHPYPRKRCWLGPECETPEAAITAWNTLMRAARETLETHERLRWWRGDVDCKCALCVGAKARRIEEEKKAPDCTEHRARGKEKSE